MSQPLFILSSGRSGSTLFQQILNATGQCSVWGEHGGILDPMAESYFTGVSQKRELLFDAPDIAWSNRFDEEGFTEAFRKLIRHLFASDCRYWGFKEVCYGNGDRVLAFLRRIFPRSIFIFLVRDPVTGTASRVKAGHWGGNVQKLVDVWNRQNSSFLQFMKNGNCHLMRYEDFTNSDSPALGALFADLDLTMTDEMRKLQKTKINAQRYDLSDVLSEADTEYILGSTAELRSRLDY